MDAMREMILALEHMQANPIVVDGEETVVSDCYGGQPLVGFPSVLAFNPNNHWLAIQYGSCWTQTFDRASWPCWVSQGGQLEYR